MSPPPVPRSTVPRRPAPSDNRPTLSRFVPKIATIETLGTSTEQRGHDFAKFLKSIHHHALTSFRNSKDVSKAILNFTDPFADLRQSVISLTQIRRNNGLNPVPPPANESNEDKFAREADNADRRDEVKLLYGIQLKTNSEREKDLTQNLTILWATIIGQCTPALQEEIHGELDYIVKSSTFDSVWLLQSLQKITAGVNKTTNKYYSAFKATKKFYCTQQSTTEGIDEFYNRFESAKDLVGLFNADIVDLTALLALEQSVDTTATKETTMQKFLVPSSWVLTKPSMNPCGTNWKMTCLLDRILIPRPSVLQLTYSPTGNLLHPFVHLTIRTIVIQTIETGEKTSLPLLLLPVLNGLP